MIDPIAFSIGSLEVRWYGILTALGFLVAIFLSEKFSKYRGLSKGTILNFSIYLIPSAIIGARIWAFTVNHQYFDSVWEIFLIWKGGLAFHGGLLGGVLAAIFYCKKNKIKVYDLLDVVSAPLALSMVLGRLANFVNQEFYGRLTNLPWGMYFDGVEGKRHPSQLYEALQNLVTFFFLFSLITTKKLKRGTIFWLLILVYSVLRFFIEFMKDMTLYYGFTYGQILSVPLIILSIIMLYKIGKS